MAVDAYLVERLRGQLQQMHIPFDEKRMFGGVAFMVNTHMTVGVTNKNQVMVRCNAAKQAELLALDGCEPMLFTGKPMSGFLFVDSHAIDSAESLQFWVQQGLDFALATPPKKK